MTLMIITLYIPGTTNTEQSTTIDDAQAVYVGKQKQLFIDEFLIASSRNITLTMNPPHQIFEPILVADKPWEVQGIGAYNTVLKEGEKFRMWYDALFIGGLPQEGARRLCYAESTDGINWHKPVLRLVEFDASKENNIVAPRNLRRSMQGATVFIDERAPEEERYKLWSKLAVTKEDRAKGLESGLWAMYSPDGIHWTPYGDNPNPNTKCDTQNVPFWDDRIEKYVGYVRIWDEDEDGRRWRSVGRVESDDFHNWSKVENVFEADDLDLNVIPARENMPVVDFYTSAVMKYPFAQDVYFMLPSAFWHWGEDGFPDTMDVQLLTSRDGIKWQRSGSRKPFMRLGPTGSLASKIIFASPRVVRVGDELWIYFAGFNQPHGAESRNSALFRATLRLDGFISADTPYHLGELITVPIIFRGSRLELNLDTSAGGSLKVEIQDESGHPIDGFRLEDADGLNGNSVRMPVTWNGKSDVSALSGKTVKIRFVMRDTKLYAFQFTC